MFDVLELLEPRAIQIYSCGVTCANEACMATELLTCGVQHCECQKYCSVKSAMC